jgi:hypothetical protein
MWCLGKTGLDVKTGVGTTPPLQQPSRYVNPSATSKNNNHVVLKNNKGAREREPNHYRRKDFIIDGEIWKNERKLRSEECS